MITQLDRLSPDEYLNAERHSDVRHEYINGHVVAMAGASSTHVLLVTNLIALCDRAFAVRAVSYLAAI